MSDPGSALTDWGGMAGCAWREVTYWEVRGSLALRKQWKKDDQRPEWLTDTDFARGWNSPAGRWAYKGHCWATEGKGSLKNKTFISDYIPQNTLNHKDFAVQSVSHWIVH